MAAAVEDNLDDNLGASNKSTTPNYPGPNPNLKYPLTIVYCGECGLPVELCEYSPNPDNCKDWLEKTHPNLLSNLNNLAISNNEKKNETATASVAAAASNTSDAAASSITATDADGKKSSHQRRGGKGNPKPKKERQPSKVILSKQQRKGNKYVTIIQGLQANGIELDVAKKFLAQRFACGCTKGDGDELIIQGDVLDNLFDVIPEHFSEISEDMVEEKS